MAPPLLRILLGLMTVIGGALVAFNPGPPGFRASRSLPVTGVLLIAAAIWMIVDAWCVHRGAKAAGDGRHASGAPPRHVAQKGRTTDRR